MSRDADVFVSCKCGRWEIVKKGGYHDCDLAEIKRMGNVASTLCHAKPGRSFVRLPLLAATIFVLLLTPLCWLWSSRKRQECVVNTLLERGFYHYQHGRYAEAVENNEAALVIDGRNTVAKENLTLIRRYLP